MQYEFHHRRLCISSLSSTFENHHDQAGLRLSIKPHGPTSLQVESIVTNREGISIHLVNSPPGLALGQVFGVPKVDRARASGHVEQDYRRKSSPPFP